MKKIFIAIVLLLFWFFATVIYSSLYTGSFTVVSYNHSKDNFTDLPNAMLLKGEKISGKFRAEDNNLGIVAIRFKQQLRIPWRDEDILIFRIKQEGSEEWIYENQYYSGLTFDVPFLPFGFSTIPDSKGKIFIFELESTKGNEFNGIEISRKNPILSSRYQVDKAELLTKPSEVTKFLLAKAFNSLDTPDILFSSIVYSFPLLFYILWISGVLNRLISRFEFVLKPQRNNKVLKKILNFIHRNDKRLFISMLVLISSIVYDVFLLQILNDVVYLVVISLWLFILRLAKIDNQVTYISALLLLIIAPFAIQFDSKSIADKAISWAFIFLTGGIIMEIIQLRKAKK